LLKICLQGHKLSKYELHDGLLGLNNLHKLSPEFEVGGLHQKTSISAKVLHVGLHDKEMGLLEDIGIVKE